MLYGNTIHYKTPILTKKHPTPKHQQSPQTHKPNTKNKPKSIEISAIPRKVYNAANEPRSLANVRQNIAFSIFGYDPVPNGDNYDDEAWNDHLSYKQI